MLNILAVACFALALALGTLEFVGVTPGAAGTVSVILVLAIGLLVANAIVNYSHNHHHHRHAHR